MTFVSYAQNFEDVLLWRALRHVQGGFYIDVGACHPDTDSVTRAFYDRGWSGINVEPGEGAYRRFAASRPRDINVQAALGAAAGHAAFYRVPGEHAGLSTLDPAAAGRYAAMGFTVSPNRVAVQTLAALCRAHAPAVVHFLKIDTEGTEADVLRGADFSACRPWIVLVESTTPMAQAEAHHGWEPILTGAGYEFVWFDGLNRFYVAAEHRDALAPHFRLPPNVFDDFLRAADTEWARRVFVAEGRAEALVHYLAQTRPAQEAHPGLVALPLALRDAEARAEAAEARHQAAAAWVAALQRSSSWRITAPLRRLAGYRAVSVTAAPRPALAHARRAVHQFHAGTAPGDAITNAMLLTQRVLRGLGYDSLIFAVSPGPEMADVVHDVAALPRHDDYVLIVRHSMGHDALDQILALSAPKVLLYHNITPPHLLIGLPQYQEYAALGRAQLQRLRPAVAAALADSIYNVLDLRQAGFDAAPCTLLFDVAALEQAALPRTPGPVFTILFVGRVAPSKGQLALVEAFAQFRTQWDQPCRLFLVGRPQEPYAALVQERVYQLGLHDEVTLAGFVTDAALLRYYAMADMFVSASLHEGFGVPLVEAVARGVPVLAVDAGAVPYTLDGAGLVPDDAPGTLAGAMLAMAVQPAARNALLVRQRQAIQAHALDRHIPALVAALVQAGAAPPVRMAQRAALVAQTRFTIAGHIGGSYSLAAVNRTLAINIEQARPGRVRVVPAIGDGLPAVPAPLRPALQPLLDRAPHPTAPHVVISQHYPVWVPPDRGDVLLALFFWEESVVPGPVVAVLNQNFAGVLAPSWIVARALVDSGVRVPVTVVGHAPDLAPFRALRDRALRDRALRDRALRDRALHDRASPAAEAPFTFLHVSSGLPRKGVDLLLTAFARAFPGGTGARLVIKTAPGAVPGTPPPSVQVMTDDLTEVALLDLYAAADAMVLPTRGEGYNLPAAEALAAGLTLIVTGHGGHMDFVADAPAGAVRLVAYTLQPSASHLASPGSLWAEPDVDDLVRALQEVAGRPRIVRGYDWPMPDIAGLIAAAAADALLTAPRNARPAVWITPWGVHCGVAEYARQLVAAMPEPVTILADTRADAGAGVHPVWTTGADLALPALATAIQQQDPRIVVIQHHPALIGWTALPGLLAAPALVGRVVCVVLHNTREIAGHNDVTRGLIVGALARMSRVVMHTLADMNGLSALGLRDNIILIPHGAGSVAPGPAIRALVTTRPVTIGSTGFFMPHKGIGRLIEALAILRRTWPRARLILANAANPDPASLVEIAACQALAAQLSLTTAVTFQTDFLDPGAARALLQICDLIALPYQATTEASSAAMRTALTAGVPVAVTPLPLFDEAADAVLRLPGLTPEAIAAGLDTFLRDQAGRQAAVDAAGAWLASRAWPVVAAQMDGMLQGLDASGVVVRA